MVDSQGNVKILDMGLAHWTDRGGSPLDPSRRVVGTPNFMAPEQALESWQVDARADIYSLGCTLYFLLTGQVPFTGESLKEILLKHQQETPIPIQMLRPSVPQELAEICMAMMEKRAEDRYASAEDVRDALAYWLEDTDVDDLEYEDDDESAEEYEFADFDDQSEDRYIEEPRRTRVLVAEADRPTLEVLDRQLIKAGYDVVLAADSQAAVDLMDQEIDVCLYDLKMPGMDGLEYLRWVLYEFPHVPILLITGPADLQTAVAAMREGAFDYFTKPCKLSTVLARIEDALVSRRQSEYDDSMYDSVMERVDEDSDPALDDFLSGLAQDEAH